MPTRKEYDQTLDRLAGLLKRKPMTARSIAEVLGCCKPAAYQRIAALQARGHAVYTLPTQEDSRPGPRSVLYGIRSHS